MAKQQWFKVENVAEWLRAGRVVRGEHAFTKRALHWPYCAHCGLMLLKNARTEKMRRQPCVQLDD